MDYIGFGIGLYILVLIPGAPPLHLDLLTMMISGISIASLAIIGFDLPSNHKKQGLVFLASGVLILLVGIAILIIGHVYFLFIVALPPLGVALLGLREIKIY